MEDSKIMQAFLDEMHLPLMHQEVHRHKSKQHIQGTKHINLQILVEEAHRGVVEVMVGRGNRRGGILYISDDDGEVGFDSLRIE